MWQYLYVESVVQPKDLNMDLFDGFIGTIFSSGTWASFIDNVATIFTILFLISSFISVMAAVFKVGTWKKYAQMTTLFTFIVLVCTRGVAFFLLAIPTFTQVDNWMDIIIANITQALIFACLIGILVSFTFKLGYTLIKHPEFRKNQRTVLTTSLLMLVSAILVPIFLT